MAFIPSRRHLSTILSLIFAKNISLWFPSVCSARCARAKSNIYHVTISFFHAIIFATSLDNVWSCRPKNRSVLWVLRSRSSWRCSRRTWARRSASICLSFASTRSRRRSSRSRSICTKIRKYLLCDIFFRRWRCSNRFENEVHCMSVPGVYLWKMSSTKQQKPNRLLLIHWFKTCLLLHFISISFDTHIHIFFVQVCQIYSFEPREKEHERKDLLILFAVVFFIFVSLMLFICFLMFLVKCLHNNTYKEGERERDCFRSVLFVLLNLSFVVLLLLLLLYFYFCLRFRTLSSFFRLDNALN